jgi:hypothetical protein
MKMGTTILMSMVALAISIAFASGGMAQQKPVSASSAQEIKLEKFSGVIEKVDEVNRDVLLQRHRKEMTFSLDDHTKIVEGKKELSFTDLKKGMWASVEYKKEGNKLLAESMHVSMPKMPAKKENPSEKATSSEKTPEKK